MLVSACISDTSYLFIANQALEELLSETVHFDALKNCFWSHSGVLLSYLQILRSSFGPLDLLGLRLWRYSGSLTVRAKIGADVPPAGALFLLLSVFIAIVCVVGLPYCA